MTMKKRPMRRCLRSKNIFNTQIRTDTAAETAKHPGLKSIAFHPDDQYDAKEVPAFIIPAREESIK